MNKKILGILLTLCMVIVLMPISAFASKEVCTIGTTGYETLAEAISSSQDGDTIKLLGDATLTAGVTINKNLTIDGDGNKLIYTGAGNQIFNFNATDKTFTITDCEVHNKSTSGLYGLVNVASNSKGTVVITECTFADDTGSSTAIVNHDAEPNGDKVSVEFKNNVVNEFFASLFPVTREGSVFTGNMFNAIGKARAVSPVTNDGSTETIVVTDNTFVGCTKNGVISLNKSNATTTLKISGNTFTNCVNAVIVETNAVFTPDSEITNTTGGAIIVDNNGADTVGNLTITGGKYAGNTAAYTIENNGTLIISGGIFSSEVDKSFIADGFAAAENKDTATKTVYPYAVTKAPLVIDVPEVIKDANGDDITDPDARNAIKDTLDNAAVKTFDATNIENAVDLSENKEAIFEGDENFTVEQGKIYYGEEEITEAKMNMLVEVKLESATVEEEGVTTIVFDVQPIVSVTLENGTVITVDIENDHIDGNITFCLPVDSKVEATYVAVYHNDEYIGNYEIKGTGTDKYIEITSDSFSPFTCKLLNPANTTVKLNNIPYDTLEHTFDDLKNGDTITLTANADGTVTVSEAIEFTLVDNGFTAPTITAAKGYSLTVNGSIYKVTKNLSAFERLLAAIGIRNISKFTIAISVLEIINKILDRFGKK